MPDAAWAVSGISQANPEGMATPRFWHRLIRFRHVISGLLALASLNLAGRDLVPPFPQRSPPSPLTTAACGGLRSTPNCRPRRALLHLSYSYASPYGRAILVTHGQQRKYSMKCHMTCKGGACGPPDTGGPVSPDRSPSEDAGSKHVSHWKAAAQSNRATAHSQPVFTRTATSSESGTPTAATERKKPFCHWPTV